MTCEEINEAIRKDFRYREFITPKNPEMFKELFQGDDIPLVQVHLFDLKDTFLINFTGSFR